MYPTLVRMVVVSLINGIDGGGLLLMWERIVRTVAAVTTDGGVETGVRVEPDSQWSDRSFIPLHKLVSFPLAQRCLQDPAMND